MLDLSDYTDTEWRNLSRQYPGDYGGYWPGDDDLLRVGIGQSRDSDALEESNYRCTLRLLRETATENGLDPDETVQEHRASHWAVGWVESLWIADEPTLRDAVRDLHAALANYPVVDDSDHSELEHEQLAEIHDDIMQEALGYRARVEGLEDPADDLDDDDRALLKWAVVNFVEENWTPSPNDVDYTPYITRAHSLLRGGRTDVEVSA